MMKQHSENKNNKKQFGEFTENDQLPFGDAHNYLLFYYDAKRNNMKWDKIEQKWKKQE